MPRSRSTCPSMPGSPAGAPDGRRIHPAFLSVLLCAGTLLAQTPSAAAPGDLDPSFGTGGKVTTSVGAEAQAVGAAVEADGKLVVAGYSVSTSNKGTFVLARYADGTLDPSFGTAGVVSTPFPKNAQAFGMALQADGRIVVVGFSRPASGHQRFALARYRTNGHLDPSFGTGGKATTKWGAGGEAQAVAIGKDGKIVAAGWSVATGSQQFAVARYRPNGHLDPTFGKGGKVSTDLGHTSQVFAAAVQDDGKIVAAGYLSTVTGNTGVTRLTVVRYLVNGDLDPGFGTGGIAVTNLGGRSDLARAVTIQKDGKIIAAGQTIGSNSVFAMVRYDTNGHPDPTFGSGGIVTTDFGGGSLIFAVAVAPNDSIIAAGAADPSGQFQANFAMARYTENGVLDPSFGSSGTVITDFGAYDTIHAIAFDGPASSVAAVGFTGTDGNSDKFALARYLMN